MGSIEIMGTLITGTAFIITLLITYSNGLLYDKLASPGEANLISIFAIISIQLFIGFFYYDATQQPLFRRLNKLRKL